MLRVLTKISVESILIPVRRYNHSSCSRCRTSTTTQGMIDNKNALWLKVSGQSQLSRILIFHALIDN